MVTKSIRKILAGTDFTTDKLIFLSPNRNLFSFGDNFCWNFDFT